MTNPQDIYNSILQYAGELNNTPQAGKFLLIGCLIPVPEGQQDAMPMPFPIAGAPQDAPPSSEAIPQKKRSTHRSKAKTQRPEKEPLLETFTRKKGLTDQHFTLLHGTLQEAGWIDPTSSPDDFISLFCGQPSNCKVIWNQAAGKGILRDLFKMMVEGGFIAPPPGHGYLRIVESHFIYTNGRHVTGLKGGYPCRKALSVLASCRDILLLNPRAKGYCGLRAEVEEQFTDIRYTSYE